MEEFKYLGVLFISEERGEQETDRQIGTMASVTRTPYQSW